MFNWLSRRKLLRAGCTPEECIRRVKRAGGTGFAFMQGSSGLNRHTDVSAYVRERGIKLRGRYGPAKWFMIRLDVNIEDAPNGESKLNCTVGFVWPMLVFIYVWVGGIFSGVFFLFWATSFGPVRLPLSQTLIAMAIPAAMLAFFAILISFLRFVAGAREEDYLLGCLSQAVERA